MPVGTGALPYDPMRVGCIVATGIGGIQTIELQHDVLRDRGPARMSPLGIPAQMSNAAAAAVSMKYGAQGPDVQRRVRLLERRPRDRLRASDDPV